MRIGVLGTGSLAEYLIRGAPGAGYDFVLSPRSPDRAARLAAAYGCTVAAGNQAVVDACDRVLVCLPAGAGLGILQGLTFHAGQSVCSAMAGADIDALRAAVAPAQGFCSMMPGYANAFRAGPSLLYPPDPVWADFLAVLGPVHPFETAREFETAAVFGAMSGASIFLMRHLARWYQARGLPSDTARQLVAETFRGNAEVLLHADAGLDAIAKGVTTPGGITEALVASLDARGALTAWDEAMDKVLKRMVPHRD